MGDTRVPLEDLFHVVPLLNDEGTGPHPDFNFFVDLSEFFPVILGEEFRDLQALESEASDIPGFDRVYWQEAETVLVQSHLPAQVIKANFVALLAPKITGDWQTFFHPRR